MNFFSLFKRNLIYKFKKKINIDQDNVEKENLDQLLHHYGSDKANIFKKTKDSGHGFSKFYVNHFAKFKRSNLKILEIGSYKGGSAAAFSKYLTNSTICCFDVNISNFSYSSKNIYVFGVDIRNRKKINENLTKIIKELNIDLFDVIIDDGSHNLSDILLTLKNLFKILKRKGLYVIEDYKYPNYYRYNNDIDEILIDQMLDNLKRKKIFSSNIISFNEQKYFQKEIKKIDTYKGNFNSSDICFIEKN